MSTRRPAISTQTKLARRPPTSAEVGRILLTCAPRWPHLVEPGHLADVGQRRAKFDRVRPSWANLDQISAQIRSAATGAGHGGRKTILGGPGSLTGGAGELPGDRRPLGGPSRRHAPRAPSSRGRRSRRRTALRGLRDPRVCVLRCVLHRGPWRVWSPPPWGVESGDFVQLRAARDSWPLWRGGGTPRRRRGSLCKRAGVQPPWCGLGIGTRSVRARAKVLRPMG